MPRGILAMVVQLRAVAAGAMPGHMRAVFAGQTCRRFPSLRYRERNHRRIRRADRSLACDAAKFSSRLFFAHLKCETPSEAARRGERFEAPRGDWAGGGGREVRHPDREAVSPRRSAGGSKVR